MCLDIVGSSVYLDIGLQFPALSVLASCVFESLTRVSLKAER